MRSEFSRVGKGALATAHHSITDHALKWWARFRLRSSSYGETSSLCPPYEATLRELICLAGKRNLDAPVRQINTTGKSLLIFRNRVKPANQKYSA